MENLEFILKNKKNVIIIICIIVILITIGIILFINYTQNNGESITTLEQMEQELEGNKPDENKCQENVIVLEDENMIENEEIETIAIHITGEVKKTGIIYLKKGGRIADAIKEAGGATKNAGLDQVNLAYILEDGQKIYIPNKNEKIEKGAYIMTNSGQNVLVEEGKQTSGNKTNTKGVSAKVNINTATQTELETLPGIGPSLAKRIIEYRETNGKFKKIEDIQNVKGIGDSKYSNIKGNICI